MDCPPPASLLRGRFLTLHGPADGAGWVRFWRRPAPKMTVPDRFITRFDVIARTLNTYCSAASSGDKSLGDGRCFGKPDLYWARESLESPNEPRRRHLLTGAVVLVVLYGVMMLLGLALYDEPMMKSVGKATAVAATTAIFWGRTMFRSLTPNGNLVLLSNDGLHLRKDGERKHWLWSDIAGLDLGEDAADAESGVAGARFLTLSATHDGHGPALFFATPKTERIDDVYDTPIAEIAHRRDRPTHGRLARGGVWRHRMTPPRCIR